MPQRKVEEIDFPLTNRLLLKRDSSSFKLMYEGPQHYTYLRSHDKTFPASGSEIYIAVKKQPLHWFLTALNSKDSSIKTKLDCVDFDKLCTTCISF